MTFTLQPHSHIVTGVGAVSVCSESKHSTQTSFVQCSASLNSSSIYSFCLRYSTSSIDSKLNHFGGTHLVSVTHTKLYWTKEKQIKQISVLVILFVMLWRLHLILKTKKYSNYFWIKMRVRYHEYDFNVLDGECLTAQTHSVFSSVNGYYVWMCCFCFSITMWTSCVFVSLCAERVCRHPGNIAL